MPGGRVGKGQGKMALMWGGSGGLGLSLGGPPRQGLENEGSPLVWLVSSSPLWCGVLRGCRAPSLGPPHSAAPASLSCGQWALWNRAGQGPLMLSAEVSALTGRPVSPAVSGPAPGFPPLPPGRPSLQVVTLCGAWSWCVSVCPSVPAPGAVFPSLGFPLSGHLGV